MKKAIIKKLSLLLTRKTYLRIREDMMQLKKGGMQKTESGDLKSVPKSTKKQLSIYFNGCLVTKTFPDFISHFLSFFFK